MSAFIIHGHFYQPPRENPWTGILDREESAAPFHNWNERIHTECYRPNAFARMFDEHGRVIGIVNNYEHLSFNFGPTLLSWLEQAHSETYQRILEADRLSVERHRGHGNAIAQGYNHAILPLCNERDLRTQLLWGIADFRHRFHRSPEAIWLPETACNNRTLDALIDMGRAFVILSPTQALRVRAFDSERWRDVSDESIDPREAYIYFAKDGSGRSIAVFFYESALSRAIAFEGALSSSSNLTDRLARAAGPMVNVATDGESYGHHFPFGERCIAYAFAREAAAQRLEITNYGEFLERNRPRAEVELKPGPNGEGTAWSCPHGVGRWYRDCGCNTGAHEGWNQGWRGPLRRAFDLLRDRAAMHFDATRDDLFHDPWAARDDYIQVILNRDHGGAKFLSQHGARLLTPPDLVRTLAHLEAQRVAMMMYTSCGWFFADLSGIETIQVMKYAGRTIDLLEELHLPSPRADFLDVLAEARSNVEEMGNGADLFRRFVEPCRATPNRIAANLAMTSLAAAGDQEGRLGDYRYATGAHQTRRHSRLTVSICRLTLRGGAVSQTLDCAAGALHLGGLDFYCALKPYPGDEAFRKSADAVWQRFDHIELPALLRLIQNEFGPDEFGLDDLLAAGRDALCEIVYESLSQDITTEFMRIYEHDRRIVSLLDEAGFESPPALRIITEYTLERRLEEAILATRRSLSPGDYEAAARIADDVLRHRYRIDKSRSNRLLETMIVDATLRAVASRDKRDIQTALSAIGIARRLHLEPNLDRAQEGIHAAYRNSWSDAEPLAKLAEALGLGRVLS